MVNPGRGGGPSPIGRPSDGQRPRVMRGQGGGPGDPVRCTGRRPGHNSETQRGDQGRGPMRRAEAQCGGRRPRRGISVQNT